MRGDLAPHRGMVFAECTQRLVMEPGWSWARQGKGQGSVPRSCPPRSAAGVCAGAGQATRRVRPELSPPGVPGLAGGTGTDSAKRGPRQKSGCYEGSDRPLGEIVS